MKRSVALNYFIRMRRVNITLNTIINVSCSVYLHFNELPIKYQSYSKSRKFCKHLNI